MDHDRDYFKHIDFDKDWDEDDWELFFQAQDRLLSEMRPAPRSSGSVLFRGSGLSFRQVLQRFGMDPDDVELPEMRSSAPTAADGGEYWREGALVESLPVYCQAKGLVHRITTLFDFHFGKKMYKPYKSPAYKQSQDLLHRVILHADQVVRDVAYGHELGYSLESVRGNIARCKRALSHADACLGCLSRIPPRRFPAGQHRRLFVEVLCLRNHLAEWILQLRQRFVRAG